MTLSVGINAHLLTFTQGYRNAGVGRYIYYLLQALARRTDGHKYTIYCHDRPQRGDPAAGPQMTYAVSRANTIQPGKRILYEQLVLPVHVRGAVDILHAPVNVMPLLAPVPSVLTIHDLSFMVVPDRYVPSKRRYLETFTRLSTKKARHIITDSVNTRLDVIERLNVPESKVTTVPLGVVEHFSPPDSPDIAAFRARNNLPEQFLLYMGTLEPRKNLITLIDAYAQMRHQGLTWPLVLAGGKGWLYEDIFKRVTSLQLSDYIRFPGYVTFEDQPLWYASATIFIYPSTYEGFGLPVLESMACGTPVVTSNTSSLPEAAGDAGVLVDCHDPEAICDAVMQLKDRDAERERLSRAGLARASIFTWDRTAEATVKAYERVAADR